MPSGAIDASTITTPWTPAFLASSGYTGRTSLSFTGGVTRSDRASLSASSSSLKLTVTVTIIRWLVSSNCHWSAASTAASSSSGIERSTFASDTVPSVSIVSSRITTPFTPAFFASSG